MPSDTAKATTFAFVVFLVAVFILGLLLGMVLN